MFHYTVETSKSITETIQSLEENLKEESFGVLWEFNLQETLKNKGFKLERPFTVLEVCNPEEASNLLSDNQMIGYLLPCKIVVYDDNQGKTKIGMPKPTHLIQMIEDDSLQEAASDIEKRMIACIDKSK